MKFQQILTRVGLPVLGVLAIAFAYRSYGWIGVAAAASGLIMWMLLHFTRMMAVMRRAAERPIGYVASSVMLNAKLKAGMTLLHVVAMTRAFGKLLSTKAFSFYPVYSVHWIPISLLVGYYKTSVRVNTNPICCPKTGSDDVGF